MWVAVGCVVVVVALVAGVTARRHAVGRDARQLVIGLFGFLAAVGLPVVVGVFVVAFAVPTRGDDELVNFASGLFAVVVFVFGLMTVAIVAFSGAVALAVWKTSAQTARGVAAVAVGAFLILSLAAIVRAGPGLDDRPSVSSTSANAAEAAEVRRDEAARKVARWLVPVIFLTALLGLVVASPDFGDELPAPPVP